MADDIFAQLDNLGIEITEAEKELNQKVGERTAILNRLTNEYGIKWKDIDSVLKVMAGKKQNLEQKLIEGFERLKNEFSW